MIKSLYKDYFQKSRVFLYPALEIRRGVSVTPIETYMSWEGHYKIDDSKLCCLYHLRDDIDFRNFERSKLTGNKLFYDFKQVEDNKGVYVFDFSHMKDDWDAVCNGKYSTISQEFKKRILAFTGYNNGNYAYIDSFLFPARYFRLYAEMMDVPEEMLKKVGELCSKPDLEAESLDVKVMDLRLEKNQ